MEIAVHPERGEADIDAVNHRQTVTDCDNRQETKRGLALRAGAQGLI
jgi:hypothetical protein